MSQKSTDTETTYKVRYKPVYTRLQYISKELTIIVAEEKPLLWDVYINGEWQGSVRTIR